MAQGALVSAATHAGSWSQARPVARHSPAAGPWARCPVQRASAGDLMVRSLAPKYPVLGDPSGSCHCPLCWGWVFPLNMVWEPYCHFLPCKDKLSGPCPEAALDLFQHRGAWAMAPMGEAGTLAACPLLLSARALWSQRPSPPCPCSHQRPRGCPVSWGSLGAIMARPLGQVSSAVRARLKEAMVPAHVL